MIIIIIICYCVRDTTQVPTLVGNLKPPVAPGVARRSSVRFLSALSYGNHFTGTDVARVAGSYQHPNTTPKNDSPSPPFGGPCYPKHSTTTQLDSHRTKNNSTPTGLWAASIRWHCLCLSPSWSLDAVPVAHAACVLGPIRPLTSHVNLAVAVNSHRHRREKMPPLRLIID